MQADTYLEVGETIRPVRRDGDRRGYVIAIADTPDEALRRADVQRALARGRGRGVTDPRTHVVERGYDAIAETSSSGATDRRRPGGGGSKS